MKALKRAKREGRSDASVGRKCCELCTNEVGKINSLFTFIFNHSMQFMDKKRPITCLPNTYLALLLNQFLIY